MRSEGGIFSNRKFDLGEDAQYLSHVKFLAYIIDSVSLKVEEVLALCLSAIESKLIKKKFYTFAHY